MDRISDLSLDLQNLLNVRRTLQQPQWLGQHSQQA